MTIDNLKLVDVDDAQLSVDPLTYQQGRSSDLNRRRSTASTATGALGAPARVTVSNPGPRWGSIPFARTVFLRSIPFSSILTVVVCSTGIDPITV